MESPSPPSPCSPSSPNRLKFVCSYGGRILPRPCDGVLRYVGGETRLLSVPRGITFSELKEKLSGTFSAELVVKYQLMSEDLDALVSVRTDDDLYHMIDEYDRLERGARFPTSAFAPRFRLFLFPVAAAVAASPEPAASPEQRYVDAINGGLFTISSCGNSPTSAVESSFIVAGGGLGRGNTAAAAAGGGMHRVRSTPNLSGGGGGGSQTSSPRAYQRAGGAFAYAGGGSPLRMGGFRQEIGWGCSCGWTGGSSSSQMMRKYICSPPTKAGGSQLVGSPPRRPSYHAAPQMRRVIWE
ncbi:hypothetical protein AXF42_Ash019056 [Apostasia shenzhenica]|uniref:PB1 domain-containing protein n=1 Tax=Apostasia shenzhenica TaxID=1088818 RepID=A0A2I0BB63_9ASPA|nr:hypothetical protein AXF42_Ash019056 [Apostasia shenzhenica]